MADKTGIQWTDATWNPIRGCSVVSGGCKNCYAMRTARRHSGPGRPYEGLTELRSGKPMWNGKIRLVPELLDQPLRWTKPRRVFVNSMSDLFHEAVPDEFVMAVMGVMAACPQHVFQILTKRPERMVRLMGEDQWPLMQCAGAADKIMRPSATIARKLYAHFDDVMGESDLDNGAPLPNVWLGVSVEDQATADERIPLLLQCPAAVRWVSAEPLLGPVDFGNTLGTTTLPLLTEDNLEAATGGGFVVDASKIEDRWTDPGVDWVVVGGESGPGHRTLDLAWARSIRAQCADAGVPFFMKQTGSSYTDSEDPSHQEHPNLIERPMVSRKGGHPADLAAVGLNIREWPKVAA